jgi:hypothetical protein
MKFKVEIALGNDGMQFATDVARALKGVAAKLSMHDMRTFEEMDAFDRTGLIFDANGNRVGNWKAVNNG